jgi:hypothetical protein
MAEKNHKSDAMKEAYKIAQELLKDRLKEANPEAFEEISGKDGADVLVVKGQYDFIEQVLSLAGVPFKLVHTQDLSGYQLQPDQIVFINCPGNIEPVGLRKLERFVSSGGFLFTTDWALKNVLEQAFPGYVKYNQKATGDEVVRVEVLDVEDPFLKSILGPEDDPQWWLEASSYPIQIVNGQRVKVLVSSREIERKYGESPVFITFEYGEGKIYHMISHFYLQRTETRTKRHQDSAETYLDEKKIPAELREKYKQMKISKSSLGEVESAYTSAAMMNKIIYDKRQYIKKKRDKDGK